MARFEILDDTSPDQGPRFEIIEADEDRLAPFQHLPNPEAAYHASKVGLGGKLLGAVGLDDSGERAATSWGEALEHTVKGPSLANAVATTVDAAKRGMSGAHGPALTRETAPGLIADAATVGGAAQLGGMGAASPVKNAVGLQGAVVPAPRPMPAKLAARNAVAQAADTLGVELPRVAATGDGLMGRSARGVAGLIKDIPLIGTPIAKATAKAQDQMQAAASGIAERYEPGTSQLSAGEALKDGLAGWITDGSQNVLRRLYDNVDEHLPPHETAPLETTASLVRRLTGEDAAAGTTINRPAIDVVSEALGRTDGLTYDGLKRLRTTVGAMIDDSLLPNAGTSKPGLRRLYGALTDDLRRMVGYLGGPAGRAAWDKATRVAEIVEERREALAKIIGADGSRAPESILDRVVTMAGTKSTADAHKLALARKTLGGSAWNDVAGASIHRLGRDQSNNFNLTTFLKNYSALSENGRNLLFASTGKDNLKFELDALAQLSGAVKNLNNLANHSKSGVLATGTAATAGLVTNPLTTVATAVGAHVLARAMAKPVRVRQIANYTTARRLSANRAPLVGAALVLARGLAEDGGGDAREIAAKLLSEHEARP